MSYLRNPETNYIHTYISISKNTPSCRC